MRLIDADALDELIVESYHMTEQEYVRAGYSIVRLLMDKVPTVDAVPVVRCKDCKWHDDDFCVNLDVLGFYGDDYCSLGGRREE